MQGFNRYFPTDFDPKKHDTLNNYHGKHALGDRARKLKSGGGLIVRFELPIEIVCLGCENYIGQGVRYNAEKIKSGNYYSTPIWSFKCKCHLCSNYFVIRTDPKNTRYEVVEGAREKITEWDPEAEGSFPVRDHKGEQPKDAFASLETSVEQKQKALTMKERLEELENQQSSRWSDPFSLSRKLRSSLRKDKKVLKDAEKERKTLVDRLALSEGMERELENLEGEFSKETEQDRQNRIESESESWQQASQQKEAYQLEQEKNKQKLKAELGLPTSNNKKRKFDDLSSTTTNSTTSKQEENKKSKLNSLASRLFINNARKSDPFLTPPPSSSSKSLKRKLLQIPGVKTPSSNKAQTSTSSSDKKQQKQKQL